MENRQFELMLEAARSRLLRHVPEEISEKAGVRYENGAFWVRTFGRCVEVQWPDGKITPPVSKWHALTLLHYLDLADGTPLTGRTITFSQYKDGLVRGGGLDRNAELIVRRDLGVLPREELARRCETLGAERCRPTRTSARGLILHHSIPCGSRSGSRMRIPRVREGFWSMRARRTI